MNHGGISRAETLCLIARAQGRACSYVTSDMGATVPTWWQFWQCSWKIGATFFANVTWSWAGAAMEKKVTAASNTKPLKVVFIAWTSHFRVSLTHLRVYTSA